MARLMVRLGVALAVFLSALAGTAPVSAQDADGLAIEKAVLTMRAGGHIWRDNSVGTVSIVISIPMQKAFVYRGGALIGASTVSTGKRGKETPVGEFKILQKQLFHRSNLYSNAPMPYMQRLTWTGIAMHAGHLPGYPASHGCIRFPASFAKQLFAITEMGADVAIIDRPIDDPAFRPEPVEPPSLMVPPELFAGERYNAVLADASWAVAPGEAIFGPSHPIVQPIAERRLRR